MILFLRFRRATLLLTRGMVVSLRLEQAHQALLIRMRDHRALAQTAFPLGMLFGEDVALVGVIAPDLSGPGDLHALPQRPLGFHLRHDRTSGIRCRVSGVGMTGE